MLYDFSELKDKLVKSFINIGYGYGFNFSLIRVEQYEQQLLFSEFNDNILASIKFEGIGYLTIKDNVGNWLKNYVAEYEYLFEMYFKNLANKYSNEEE